MLIAAMLLCVGCTGPEGPMGPRGEQGDEGARGLRGEPGQDGQDGSDGQDGVDGQDGEDGAGTRVWYYGTIVVPTNDWWCYTIPEITLNDMPLISVYAAPLTAPNTWAELPVFTQGMSGDGQFYVIEEGRICVENCFGLWIRIVIVT